MLETWWGSTRRWHILHPENLASVRQKLPPNSILAVYPTPPSPDFEAVTAEATHLLNTGTAPLAALTEEPGSGVLRFAKLSTMDELATWLDRPPRRLPAERRPAARRHPRLIDCSPNPRCWPPR